MEVSVCGKVKALEQTDGVISEIFLVNSKNIEIYTYGLNNCSIALAQYDIIKEFIKRTLLILLGIENIRFINRINKKNKIRYYIGRIKSEGD